MLGRWPTKQNCKLTHSAQLLYVVVHKKQFFLRVVVREVILVEDTVAITQRGSHPCHGLFAGSNTSDLARRVLMSPQSKRSSVGPSNDDENVSYRCRSRP